MLVKVGIDCLHSLVGNCRSISTSLRVDFSLIVKTFDAIEDSAVCRGPFCIEFVTSYYRVSRTVFQHTKVHIELLLNGIVENFQFSILKYDEKIHSPLSNQSKCRKLYSLKISFTNSIHGNCV